MYDLGIIGGMGPKATAVAFDRIVNYTDATCDQDHVNIVILNHATIPDRTEAIQDGSAEVKELLVQDFKLLENLGVPLAISICNTAHHFIRPMQQHLSIRFIDMIDSTTEYLHATYPDGLFCVLGTTGFVAADVFNQHDNPHKIVYPSYQDQCIVMQTVNDIKAGIELERAAKEISVVLENIAATHPGIVFVLACTEISLIRDFLCDRFSCVDCMDLVLITALIESGALINKTALDKLDNQEYFQKKCRPRMRPRES
jgi:aspartate racemase